MNVKQIMTMNLIMQVNVFQTILKQSIAIMLLLYGLKEQIKYFLIFFFKIKIIKSKSIILRFNIFQMMQVFENFLFFVSVKKMF